MYFHHGSSIVALSGVRSAEATLARGLATVLPRFEVLWHGLSVFSNIRKHLLQVQGVTGPWRRGELLIFTGFVMALGLIVLSPLLLDSTLVTKVLAEQLVPWRL